MTASVPADPSPGLVAGLVGPALVGVRAEELLARSAPGDVAVVDQADLTPRTARALLDAGVVALLNARPTVSGRFPATGAALLLDAGVVLVDALGAELPQLVREGDELRVEGPVVHLPDGQVLVGRLVGAADLAAEVGRARAGLLARVDTFTHSAGEFLRREQELVLNGTGLPDLRTDMTGRPAVVVARTGGRRADVVALHRFVREQDPVLVAVDHAADDVLEAGLAPHVVVISGSDPAAMPSVDALRAADDVVVRVERGEVPHMLQTLGRLTGEPVRCETVASAEDVALLLADAGGASLVVGLGVVTDLDTLLDTRAPASTYLTRLKLGHRLVDASAVPQLYAGRVRPWHVLAVTLAGLVALVAAIGVTPVGQGWLDDLQGVVSDLTTVARGLLS